MKMFVMKGNIISGYNQIIFVQKWDNISILILSFFSFSSLIIFIFIYSPLVSLSKKKIEEPRKREQKIQSEKVFEPCFEGKKRKKGKVLQEVCRLLSLLPLKTKIIMLRLFFLFSVFQLRLRKLLFIRWI